MGKLYPCHKEKTKNPAFEAGYDDIEANFDEPNEENGWDQSLLHSN